jgi:hypothetical protein
VTWLTVLTHALWAVIWTLPWQHPRVLNSIFHVDDELSGSRLPGIISTTSEVFKCTLSTENIKGYELILVAIL